MKQVIDNLCIALIVVLSFPIVVLVFGWYWIKGDSNQDE